MRLYKGARREAIEWIDYRRIYYIAASGFHPFSRVELDNFKPRLESGIFKLVHILAEQFVFWEVIIGVLWKRESRPMCNGTNVTSQLANFFSVFTANLVLIHGLADRQILISFSSSPLKEKWRRFLQERRHFSLRSRARGGVPCKKSPARAMTQLIRKLGSNYRSANPCLDQTLYIFISCLSLLVITSRNSPGTGRTKCWHASPTSSKCSTRPCGYTL